jgi:hypothetical protein
MRIHMQSFLILTVSLALMLSITACSTSPAKTASTLSRDQLAAEVRRFSTDSREWYWSYHGTCDQYHHFSRSRPTELSLAKTQIYQLPVDQMRIDSRTVMRLSRAPDSVPPLSGKPCFEQRHLVNDRLVVDYDVRHGIKGG